ncbi:Mis6-domain-containing protein [Setomelanomma holmii]|uniref:Mis6-domain-containing protein n=1 Tax=Setomelanomma holmii TaxID=210430 RepID=A0A9P4LNY4_9PLEO|nr:Mis6-domain-containing protein [Setomelanomma holmii]
MDGCLPWVTASRIPAKQRTVKVSSVVDAICRYALEDGLNEDSLRDIVQLASVKTNLDQTSITTLIKNLYPAQRVPGDVVTTIVGALGQGKGKPSPGTQDSLVKWLTIVHEVIEDPNVLSRLYGVLFGMLDMISISRTSLCHLLSLITRRKHVKPFRIQQLLELARGLGNEPVLQGLLRIFKDYYPDIILGRTSTSRKSFAPQPDAEWQTRISAILDASTAADETTANRYNGFKVSRRGPKRSKASAIPDVHTYHATEASVTLEGIDNADDFVEKLDRIEPPGQMVSFLTDPLLQKFVELQPAPIISTRIDLWLSICLEDLYRDEKLGSGDYSYLREILEGLLKHVQYTKTLHSITLDFLKAYLPIWNGSENIDTILSLLTYVPFDRWDDAYKAYFMPVEKGMATQAMIAYDKLIDMYTSLLQNQASAATALPDSRNLTEHQTFHNLVAHVSTLSMSLLLSLAPGTGHTLTSSILTFYEYLSTSSKPHFVPIMLPPMHLIYLVLQNASPTTFSRVCGIIGAYKAAFDTHPKPVKDYYPAHVTDALNWCLRDIYHLIWIARALITADQKALGLHCDTALRTTLNDYVGSLDREYAIGAAFGLSNNSWLSSMSASAWRALEEREISHEGFDRNTLRYHQGPVSQRSLDVLKRKGGVSMDWDGSKGYKVFVLEWMAQRGLGGVRELMFATVSELRTKA